MSDLPEWRKRLIALQERIEALDPNGMVPVKDVLEMYEDHKFICLELADQLQYVTNMAKQYLTQHAPFNPPDKPKPQN
jgi:hypothetical protein